MDSHAQMLQKVKSCDRCNNYDTAAAGKEGEGPAWVLINNWIDNWVVGVGQHKVKCVIMI